MLLANVHKQTDWRECGWSADKVQQEETSTVSKYLSTCNKLPCPSISNGLGRSASRWKDKVVQKQFLRQDQLWWYHFSVALKPLAGGDGEFCIVSDSQGWQQQALRSLGTRTKESLAVVRHNNDILIYDMGPRKPVNTGKGLNSLTDIVILHDFIRLFRHTHTTGTQPENQP